MRYCKKCGAALNDEMLFCQKCGTKCVEEQPKTAYAVLEDVDINTPAPKKNKNSQGSRTVATVLAVFLIIILIIILGVKGCSTNPSGNEDQSSQSAVKSGEDYEGDVFTAFWEGASKSFGVEYSDYKFAHTSYSWIDDFTTTDGYTAHYYLIQTAFETKNAFGQKVLHPVTARCYYVPEYSNTVYTTYMTLDGEAVLFDEEKEDWLMGMGSGGSAPSTSDESTGISWDTFVLAYNEMAAEDPEGNGYLIDGSADSNSFEYKLPNGEILSVELTKSKHIVRMEFIYPSTGTSDQKIIMHRWWVVSSIVGAFQNQLNGGEWNNAANSNSEKILAELAVAGGSDEAKATYQSGKALTSSDLDHSIIYTRYVDTEASMSHFIVYGYGNNTYSVPNKTPNGTDTNTNTSTNSAESNETAAYVPSDDMNDFLVRFILPQYVEVNGKHTNPIEYDSNESTDWCYKLEGKVGANTYEAMVYPFCDINNNVEDLWIRYLYWNGELIVENDPSQQIEYSPKKYW